MAYWASSLCLKDYRGTHWIIIPQYKPKGKSPKLRPLAVLSSIFFFSPSPAVTRLFFLATLSSLSFSFYGDSLGESSKYLLLVPRTSHRETIKTHNPYFKRRQSHSHSFYVDATVQSSDYFLVALRKNVHHDLAWRVESSYSTRFRSPSRLRLFLSL